MVPPWAKDLPNWKHYKIPQHQARDVPQQQQSTLIPTYDQSATTAYENPAPPAYEPKETECPTVCIDAINECGMRYGDCLPVCPGEKPALTPPPCPAVTGGVIPEAYLV